MVKERSVALAIILTVITCGFYGIYWFIVMTDEVNSLSGKNETSGVVAFLLTLVTCGIYGFYWCYKMGAMLDDIEGNSNGTRGILYLLLSIFGFSIISYALIQDSINKNIHA